MRDPGDPILGKGGSKTRRTKGAATGEEAYASTRDRVSRDARATKTGQARPNNLPEPRDGNAVSKDTRPAQEELYIQRDTRDGVTATQLLEDTGHATAARQLLKDTEDVAGRKQERDAELDRKKS